MSRSYKKKPVFTDNASKKHKRLANKKVRKAKNVTNGNQYKKVSESWDIHDWKFKHYGQYLSKKDMSK